MSDEDIKKLEEEESSEKTDEIADEVKDEKEDKVSDDTKEIIQMRLRQATKKHRQREAELQARIAELESAKQDPAMGAATATTQPPSPGTQPTHSTANNAPNSGNIPAEMIPVLVERKRQADEFNKKLDDAIKQDEEFKKLSQTGNSIPPEVLMNMQHLDNAPAVIKHLLKNKKAHALMQASLDEAMMNNSIVPLIKFANDLSDQLESVASKPQRSSFSPAPDLSDAGDSGQDFDIAEYVSSKR